MSLGFDSLSESPLSSISGEPLVAVVSAGQGSQTVDAIAKLQFIANATAGQGSQTVDALGAAGISFFGIATAGQGSQTVDALGAAGISFFGIATAGQGSQTIDGTALLQFIAAVSAGQGSQTVDGLGVLGNGVIATCDAGQGSQTADCAAELATSFQLLDGVGVGKGNRSWWHDKEVVVDHRLRHKGNAKAGQTAQTTEARGGVRNPFTVVTATGTQAMQTASSMGDVTDPELEQFTLLAAVSLMDDWREAA